MFSFKKWRRKKNNTARGIVPDPCPPVQDDSIILSLPMLDITLTRKISIDVPHEVSVIVPRAEIRCGEGAVELIYSSITVVHTPRHPSAGEQPPEEGETAAGETSFPVPAEKQVETAQKIPPKTGAAGELSIPGRRIKPSIKVNYIGK